MTTGAETAKHTPGEWTAEKSFADTWFIRAAGVYAKPRTICLVSRVEDDRVDNPDGGYTLRRRPIPTADADARLITAGPTMLATLHEVSEYLDNFVDVVDGADGQPEPNKAMRLKSEVDAAIKRAESA